jgi:hypothetical protein
MSALLRRQYLVTEENVTKLDNLSAAEGVSATEIVRRAIESYHTSEDDAELERLVDLMADSVREAVKEVRAARKLVRKANREYAERKAV